MSLTHDIVLAVDYHDAHCVIRQRNLISGKETVRRIPTQQQAIGDLMKKAIAEAQQQAGHVVWIQESTTGWARARQLAAECGVEFLLANVLQMPLPPKAKRRKTDKVDTARLLREYLNGELPRAHQPQACWRQLRRVVSLRENLVRRRTAVSNWMDRYLAHETWASRGLRSQAGLARLRELSLPPVDRQVIDWKLEEIEQLNRRLARVEALMMEFYQQSADAQRLDAIRGLGPIGSIAIVARIGPIERFRTPEELIAYAGLAPGIRQSDETSRGGRIGGGGTDKCLRSYLLEATVWARDIPRYHETYERVTQRRGPKIGRLVVARLLLRSIYKMLSTGVMFQSQAA
jgi:transposase